MQISKYTLIEIINKLFIISILVGFSLFLLGGYEPFYFTVGWIFFLTPIVVAFGKNVFFPRRCPKCHHVMTSIGPLSSKRKEKPQKFYILANPSFCKECHYSLFDDTQKENISREEIVPVKNNGEPKRQKK